MDERHLKNIEIAIDLLKNRDDFLINYIERLEGLVRELDQRIQAGAIRPQLDNLSKRVSELEGALQPDQPQPDSDGWIPWNGGECPVDVDASVDIWLREGDVERDCHAGSARWDHCPEYHQCYPRDITYYRPAKQEAEWPREGSRYYAIDMSGVVVAAMWVNTSEKRKQSNFLGIYPTREQAEEAAGKIKRVMEHLRAGGYVRLPIVHSEDSFDVEDIRL